MAKSTSATITVEGSTTGQLEVSIPLAGDQRG